DGYVVASPLEQRCNECGLGERNAAGHGECRRRRRDSDEGPDLGLQLRGCHGVRPPAFPVRTEDPALRGRDEALRGVAVAAPEGAPAQTDEQMPPSGVHPFTLERDEDLRNVPPATPHSAAI